MSKRAALFCRDADKQLSAKRLAIMQEYANTHSMVITQTFSSEEEVQSSDGEYDCVLCCKDVLMLPVAGIEIISL